MMTTLPDLPVELDPAYVQPVEPIEEAVLARQPRVGEWVSCVHPAPNGPDSIKREVEPSMLGQVLEVRAGDWTHGGCTVRVWSRDHMRFIETFFAPWCCIIARTVVNHYSLTGQWLTQWATAEG
jgi:hypothetical protein